MSRDGVRRRSVKADVRRARHDIARRTSLHVMIQAIADHKASLHDDIWMHTGTCYACLALARRARRGPPH